MTDSNYEVYRDFHQHTCIKVSESSGIVRFMTMDGQSGVRIEREKDTTFNKQFSLVKDYPITKACQIYLDTGKLIGVSQEALRCLGSIIKIENMEDYIMTPKTERSLLSDKKSEKKKLSLSGYATASAMIKELIREGKITDDEMFAMAQKEFGLSDDKRWYISWYRNKMKRDGENVPDAIKADAKPASKPAAKAKAKPAAKAKPKAKSKKK